MAIEIVDFPIKNGGSFHCYVNVHQRVANEHMDTSTTHGDAPRPGDRGGRVEDAAARTAKPHGNCDELYLFFMG